MGTSQYFGSKAPDQPHLVRGSGGLAGEIKDLREDIDEAFTTMENGGLLRVDTWTDAPASVDDHFVTSRATSDQAETLRASAGDFANTTVATGPRGVIITRAAAVGSYTTDDIVVKGKAYGEDITLTFTPADANGGDVVASTEDLGIDTIEEVIFPAQVDASGAFEVGFSDDLILFRTIKDLAGVATPLREVENGVVVTTGVFSGRKYTQPVNTPDGAIDYAVVYIADPAG